MGAPLGNDNATKAKPWRDALDRAIKQDDGKRMRASAEKLLDFAASGEQWAVQMLADRLDGRAAQALSITADVTTRNAADLSDDQLAAIANARSPDAPT